jgi:hypothetical protein
MITTHNLGFPRIGKKRELEFFLLNHFGKVRLHQLT